MLETEAEGRDADDELAARLEAGEVVSLGGKVLILILMMLCTEVNVWCSTVSII